MSEWFLFGLYSDAHLLSNGQQQNMIINNRIQNTQLYLIHKQQTVYDAQTSFRWCWTRWYECVLCIVFACVCGCSLIRLCICCRCILFSGIAVCGCVSVVVNSLFKQKTDCLFFHFTLLVYSHRFSSFLVVPLTHPKPLHITSYFN